MPKEDRPIVTRASSVEMQEVKAGTNTQMQVLIGATSAPNFAMRRFIMQPGGGMPKHTNEVEHEQFILQGCAKIGIGENVHEVQKGDVVYIPKGVPHWYHAEGSEPFEFLCIVPNQPDQIRILEPSQA